MLKKFVPLVLFALLSSLPIAAKEPAFPVRADRVLFLGDSITHAGHYVSVIEARLRLAGVDPLPEMINLGLPSETCSGLSEPEHPFPRPNVHERIDRALKRLKPDVVVACYGMNDGIYYPFSEDRFAAYRKGIDKIIEKVHAADAKLVLMTPPAFDPLPLKKKGSLLPAGAEKYSWKEIYEDYDQVMRRYADWINEQSDRVEMVIDLHRAVSDYVAAKRRSNPDFTMSPDGVHVDQEGHRVLAEAIAGAWQLPEGKPADEPLMILVERRQRMLHDAWLSEVGHQRPGVKAGLPIEEALKRAALMEEQIRAHAQPAQDAGAKR